MQAGDRTDAKAKVKVTPESPSNAAATVSETGKEQVKRPRAPSKPPAMPVSKSTARTDAPDSGQA